MGRKKERFNTICEDEKFELLVRLNWGIDILRVEIIRMNNKQTIGFGFVWYEELCRSRRSGVFN